MKRDPDGRIQDLKRDPGQTDSSHEDERHRVALRLIIVDNYCKIVHVACSHMMYCVPATNTTLLFSINFNVHNGNNWVTSVRDERFQRGE
jgi:hypothetical protein